jgi:hypothetical protein
VSWEEKSPEAVETVIQAKGRYRLPKGYYNPQVYLNWFDPFTFEYGRAHGTTYPDVNSWTAESKRVRGRFVFWAEINYTDEDAGHRRDRVVTPLRYVILD